MKLKRIFAGLMAIIMLSFVSCQEKEEFIPSLKVSPSTLTFETGGGEQEITITANCDWNATVQGEGIAITPASGKASETAVKAKVAVTANEAEKVREFTIIVKAGAAKPCEVKVSQAAKEKPVPSVKVTPETLAYTAEGGEQEVSIVANYDWKATVEGEGVTVTPSEGKASADPVKVSVKYAANDKSEAREAVVTFTADAAKAQVKLSQEAGKKYITISELRELSKGDSKVIPEGSYLKATVLTDSELSNMTSRKNIYIQDATAGFQVRFAEDVVYKMGAEVELNLGGQTISFFNDAVQIKDLPVENATILKESGEVKPKEVTIAEFLKNSYEGQYITLKDVQVAQADLEKNFVFEENRHGEINVISKAEEKFIIYTSKYATIKDTKVPQGCGSLSGIAAWNKGQAQIILAKATDADGMNGTRFEEAKPDLPTFEGDGKTPETAYTVADVLKYYEAGMDKTAQVWVVGPIVGSLVNNKLSKETGSAASNTNIALGTENQYIPVALDSKGQARPDLNIKENPDKLGKTVCVKGTIERYFSMAGVKGVKEYKMK